MARLILLISILSGLCTSLLAQNDHPNLEKVKEEFIAFHYQKAINLADSILGQDSTLTVGCIIEINRMKGISQFVLGQEYDARTSFLSILELDPVFQLDPVQNSPKIIRFFNDLKLAYLQRQLQERPAEGHPDSQTDRLLNSGFPKNRAGINHALWRSILLPGWGHHYLGRKKESAVLSVGSLLILPASVYFTADAYKKEKNYLNETVGSEIDSRYKAYNKSYKIRNILWAGYAVWWLYTQFDLFSGTPVEKYIEFNAPLSIEQNQLQMIGISFQFKL